MAKSQKVIYLDYKAATDIADNIKSISEDMKENLVKKLEENNNELHSNWDGDGSREFLKRASVASEELFKRVREISELANVIRDMAQRTYDAEMAALETVNTNTYGEVM